MRIAVIADCHIGNHTRYATPSGLGLTDRDTDSLRVLEAALKLAAAYPGLDYAIIAGDLFHNDKPSPALMAATMRVIEDSGISVVAVVGNHDRTALVEDALLPLQSLPNTTRIAVPRELVDPSYMGDGKVLCVPAGLESSLVDCGWNSKVNVIVAHHGIWDEDTPAFLRNTKGALSLETVREVMRSTGAAVYLAGDWHQHKVFSVPEGVVIQVGALCPTGFSDATPDGEVDPYGSVIFVNSFAHTHRRETVPHPIFAALDLTITDAHRHSPYPVYVRSTSESGQDGAIRYVSGGGVKSKSAATLRVAAEASTSREDILATVVSAVADMPASAEAKASAIDLLMEIA